MRTQCSIAMSMTKTRVHLRDIGTAIPHMVCPICMCVRVCMLVCACLCVVQMYFRVSLFLWAHMHSAHAFVHVCVHMHVSCLELYGLSSTNNHKRRYICSCINFKTHLYTQLVTRVCCMKAFQAIFLVSVWVCFSLRQTEAYLHACRVQMGGRLWGSCQVEKRKQERWVFEGAERGERRAVRDLGRAII